MDLKTTLKEHILAGNPQSDVARAMNVSITTLSLWLNDKYKGNNGRIEELAAGYLDKIAAQGEEGVKFKKDFDFVETGNFVKIASAVRLATAWGDMRIVTGESGFGKTTALKRIKADDETVILVECYKGMRKNRFMAKLALAAGVKAKGSFDVLFEAICEALDGSKRVILIDECEHLPIEAIDAVRRINDFCGCGVVLVGLPVFLSLLKRPEYSYIYNRTAIPVQLKALNDYDIQGMIGTMCSWEVPVSLWTSCSKGRGRDLRIIAQESMRVALLNPEADKAEVIEAVTKQLGRL